MIDPPRWTESQLKRDLARSTELFRRMRLEEPVEAYSNHFDACASTLEELLETTIDLTDLKTDTISRVLADDVMRDAFRYLPGPPISEDDLETLVDSGNINSRELKKDAGLASKVAETVMACLDRRRFPWVSDREEPSEGQRQAAVVATAALMAYQKTHTDRRTAGKEDQESKVRDALIALNLKEVPRKKIDVLRDAPKAGEFCGESSLSTRKADFIVGNFDGRVLAIECKVSNSSLNSVKRLNNDAAVKAASWIKDLGQQNVVPIAVLSGVYKLQNLVEAQNRGLTLIWAHSLDSLSNWIKDCERSKEKGSRSIKK